MSGVLVNQAEVIMLQALVDLGLTLRLFQNDWTLAETDTEAAATEATFTGYSAVVLTPATWTVTPGAPASADYPQQIFTSSAAQTPQNIYGYYLTRTSGGALIAAERFTGGPYVIQNNLDKIRVSPRITQD